MNRAPRKDSAGADIYEGEVIAHASGERGKVIFRHDKTEVADQWRVDYDDGGPFSSLMLQCGDKGASRGHRAIFREQHRRAVASRMTNAFQVSL